MKIGQRIKNRRKVLGMSADEMGKALGKDRSTIYRYEKGDIENLPLDILEPIAKILLTTPQYLMGWENENNALIADYEKHGFIPIENKIVPSDDFNNNEQRSLIKVRQQIQLQRMKNGYSYSQLSALTGIPKTSLQRYEIGTTTKIPIEVICKLEKAFALQSGTLTGIYYLENSAFNTSHSTYVPLSEHEASVITAYRNNIEMQKAVDVLLGVNKSESGK